MANTSCLWGFVTDHVIHGFMQQLRKYGTKIQSRLFQVLKFNDSQQFKVSAVQRQLIKETSICLWVPGCQDFFLSAISSSYSVTYTLITFNILYITSITYKVKFRGEYSQLNSKLKHS
jgi:hypothetical protein